MRYWLHLIPLLGATLLLVSLLPGLGSPAAMLIGGALAAATGIAACAAVDHAVAGREPRHAH